MLAHMKTCKLFRLQPIGAGRQIVVVPLCEELSSHQGDSESRRYRLEEAPSAVRLAAKLLREVQLGSASELAPYLQAPNFVPGIAALANHAHMKHNPDAARMKVQAMSKLPVLHFGMARPARII